MTSPKPAQRGLPVDFVSQRVALAFLLFPICVGIAAYVSLPQRDEAPPYWAFVAPLLLGMGVHGLCRVLGYRPDALRPGIPAEAEPARSREGWMGRFVLRLALCDALVLAGLAAAFVVTEAGFWVYAGFAAVGELLLLVHGWPWRRTVERVAEALERDGVRSSLREQFGQRDAGEGAIRRL